MYSVREIKMDRAMTTTWNSLWNLEKNTVQCSVLSVYTSGAHTVRFRARIFGSGFEELHASVTGHNIFHLFSPCCKWLLPFLTLLWLLSGFWVCNTHTHKEPFWTHGVSSVCTREGIKPTFNPMWRDWNKGGSLLTSLQGSQIWPFSQGKTG